MVTSQAIQNVLVSTGVHKHMVHTVISIVSSPAYVVCVYMYADTQLYIRAVATTFEVVRFSACVSTLQLGSHGRPENFGIESL